jgi:hypothetical protein
VKDAHQVALWAGVAAFFGSLLTISVVDILYSKERLQDAKRERGTVSGPR